MQEVVHQQLNFQMILKKINQVKKSLPEELDLRVSFNRANYVEAAIEEVYKTLLIAFILVVLIIYLFLGNLKLLLCLL